LLLLMGLGAAGVKAQVRIGGNTAPSKAAILDLNATDAANTGTGGLVLPRVDLTSNTMQLTTGVTNVTGTLVYDVTATLGQIGVYYWNGQSWVLASLPPTSVADSDKYLMSNGSSVSWQPLESVTVLAPASPSGTAGTVTWTRLNNFTVHLPASSSNGIHTYEIPNTFLAAIDVCNNYTGAMYGVIAAGQPAWIYTFGLQPAQDVIIACYRPSI